MRAPLTSALHFAAALVVVAGCGREHDADRQPPAPEPPAVASGELRVSDQSRAAIGLATAQAEDRDVHNSISATGWLAPRPGSEVVVKAPTTGFIVPLVGGEDALGRSVTKDQRLAELHAFLSPQEQSQL